MTQPISKSERFVREHYLDITTTRGQRLPSVWVNYHRKQNNVLKVVVAISENEDGEDTIGTGLTRLEAWRDAARNIRNSLKQQP